MKVVLEILFLTLSNADIQFAKKELTWRTYTTEYPLSTICQVELINKKKFAKVVLDENVEAFVVYIASLTSKITIHLGWKAQIALLLAKKVPVLAEYADFVNVFLKKSAKVLSERTGINEHVIELEEGKQPPYRPIYSLGPVVLETLKIYIDSNVANRFIRLSKSPAGAPILFVQKPYSSFCLCINFWGLNNLKIKNWYLLSLIGEFLDWLGQAKRFTQLDLTNAYYRMRIKKNNKWRTAFITRYGHFKYQVMFFGLSNAPASFQGYINKILAEKLNVFVIVYLADILIYTEDKGQAHVNAV